MNKQHPLNAHILEKVSKIEWTNVVPPVVVVGGYLKSLDDVNESVWSRQDVKGMKEWNLTTTYKTVDCVVGSRSEILRDGDRHSLSSPESRDLVIRNGEYCSNHTFLCVDSIFEDATRGGEISPWFGIRLSKKNHTVSDGMTEMSIQLMVVRMSVQRPHTIILDRHIDSVNGGYTVSTQWVSCKLHDR